MTNNEYEMCERQGEIFELANDNFSCGSLLFVSRFMQSDLARDMDDVESPYNYVSPNNAINRLRYQYPSFIDNDGKKYPKAVMHWVGFIYRAYSIINKISSRMIYKYLKADTLFGLYESFHTFSPEYCVERLTAIVSNIKGPQKSDYEIYKEIRLSSSWNK